MTTMDTNSQLINGDGGIVVSGSSVGGGYFVSESIEITEKGEEGKIPKYACISGALCYCKGDGKFYQYQTVIKKEGDTETIDGSWEPAKIGGIYQEEDGDDFIIFDCGTSETCIEKYN